MIDKDQKSFKPGIFMLSLSLHLILMVVFAMVQFSRGKLFSSLTDSPKAAIEALEAIEQSGIIVPKPDFKDIGLSSVGGGFYSSQMGEGVAGEGSSQGSGAGSGGNGTGADMGGANDFAASVEASAAGVLSDIEDKDATGKSKRIEFFGNVASARKVCFVVDCSGSMLGFFGQVKEKLSEVIENLQQDNFYGIIVFQGEKLLEVNQDHLVRASDRGVEEALEFIASIDAPKGKPDAFEAMKKAIAYKDSIGDSPAVVYFLTDGFDYNNFAENIEDYRKKFAPVVKIHTIGFMVNQRDAEMLKEIASKSGGKFTMYSEGVN